VILWSRLKAKSASITFAGFVGFDLHHGDRRSRNRCIGMVTADDGAEENLPGSLPNSWQKKYHGRMVNDQAYRHQIT
jgi:hypothetical protein